LIQAFTLATAYERIIAGTSPDEALAKFLDAFNRASNIQMLSDVLLHAPRLTGDARLDALAGAVADYLARQHRLLHIPAWAFEPERFLKDYAGRVIATVADPQATDLTRFQFLPEDLLLFGSESHGLPAPLVDSARARLTIPSRGQTKSLNLAVSLAIVLFEAHRQLGTSA